MWWKQPVQYRGGRNATTKELVWRQSSANRRRRSKLLFSPLLLLFLWIFTLSPSLPFSLFFYHLSPNGRGKGKREGGSKKGNLLQLHFIPFFPPFSFFSFATPPPPPFFIPFFSESCVEERRFSFSLLFAGTLQNGRRKIAVLRGQPKKRKGTTFNCHVLVSRGPQLLFSCNVPSSSSFIKMFLRSFPPLFFPTKS